LLKFAFRFQGLIFFYFACKYVYHQSCDCLLSSTTYRTMIFLSSCNMRSPVKSTIGRISINFHSCIVRSGVTGFTEDNLLLPESVISHHCQAVQEKELAPTLVYFAVLTWLNFLNDFPKLMKQRTTLTGLLSYMHASTFRGLNPDWRWTFFPKSENFTQNGVNWCCLVMFEFGTNYWDPI
jgi:hypothetical protein